MKFLVNHFLLDQEKTDCIIVGVFEEYKLTDSARYLDQFSSNYISKLIELGEIEGKIGQTLLLYNVPNICSKRILLVGCGKKCNLNKFYFNKIIQNIIIALNKISIKNVIFSITEINIKIFNVYWFIRTAIRFIKESSYKISKISSLSKSEFYLNSISFNMSNIHSCKIAKIALKHALAIEDGIYAAKKISNLPPNICNPFYLSSKSKELSEKYKDSIHFTSVDVQKMHTLGMHAYIAVSRGSKNKPYMSVLKYSKKNHKKVIVLIGKGLTFDTGGISIKSSKNMHEMKYDMCGAAAVYGIITMAAKLKLPLTIIGILAGCENMIGSNSFRPGDVLHTMSGKTVEVLNTDAEGRLVLCDVLKYVERFSPNFVIDIATLTGACVVALGNNISGFFTNSEYLSYALKKSSKQTNDKIWRLPLIKEDDNMLYSNIADFSNVGKSQAGAITAAYFLSQFSKQYSWAHLDIAGTAWNTDYNQGATGRPIELLSQFLLNESKYIL